MNRLVVVGCDGCEEPAISKGKWRGLGGATNHLKKIAELIRADCTVVSSNQSCWAAALFFSAWLIG
jgi:hypothetical protein